MNRIQRVLGYLGAVMLVTGVAITAIGPAELGIIADETDDSPADPDVTPTGQPAATASGANADTDDRRNVTDGGANDRDESPDIPATPGDGGVPSLSGVVR